MSYVIRHTASNGRLVVDDELEIIWKK